ncbi:hypothetical protein [Bradyrhizobium sp. JYMT SZCCT0180]|uniref:hypothetical protein n=1 Tax=Bradyrhizobium sp. JYMT SZCCT0180 TaxID=2807666 RepID=UPI001BA8E253|nr:hypothetical protein [Bradyrhizobium sp. JYMT SZCCT0180]MBR1209145.1 hypothetical protein [Bradyrhizobium sp. JYMT SZCCT0180]
MNRALVFALLGPVFGVLAAWSIVTVAIGAHFDSYGVPIVFFFTLIVCAIVGPVDGVLAYVVPIWLRVPMTTMVGAAVAVGLYLWVHLGNTTVPPSLHRLFPIAMIGALSMGVCSLLSHDYRGSRA